MRRTCLLLTCLLLQAWGVTAARPSEDLRRELDELRTWARAESQSIGAILASVDPEFLGVRQFGTVLSTPEDRAIGPVAAVTDSSAAYWRARLEMARTDPSVVLGRALLHVRAGEIDRASRVVHMVPDRLMTESYATSCYRELKRRLHHYVEARGRLIESGIAAFDIGDRDTALDYYEAVLAADSLCAWAWHEVFLTRSFAESESTFTEYGRRVYGADPLFTMGMQVTTGRQGFELMRRLEIDGLFADREKVSEDMLTYATIALDVREYGFGAELFWTAFSYGSEKTADAALDGFLYCLDRLGVKGIAENFIGDHQARMERVERACRERFEGSIFYRVMQQRE